MDDFLKILIALVHSVAAVSDVFIYAYGAQRVQDSAQEIFDNFRLIKKDYLLPVMISQKEIHFSAGFFNSSLHTLSVMLSRASSFITLMKSFVS